MKRLSTYVLMISAACVASPGLAQVEQVRFGNLHAHTSYSDGTGTPDEAYKMACEAKLDFFAITEHNHAAADGSGVRKDGKLIAKTPALYSGTPTSLVEMANKRNVAGRCVTLYGQEYSTISSGNHMNVFDVGKVIDADNGKFDELLSWMDQNRDSRGAVALAQFNHPETGREDRDYGRDDFGAASEANWVQAMAPFVSLIEVINAQALKPGTNLRTHHHQSLYFRYLNLGFHLAPSVGHDNHYRNWGTSVDARVAVIAPELTRPAVIDALRARHAYASEDKNLRVVFKSGDALQGDIVAPPALGSELPLTLQIKDDDEANARYKVDVFKDKPGGVSAERPIETYRFTGNQITPVALEGIRFEQAGEYVLLKITQYSDEDEDHVSEDRVWTAPIWYEEHAFHAPLSAQPKIRITKLLPDPVGDDFTEERASLKNTGAVPVNLAAWKLRDLAENSWQLDGLGTLAPGAEVSIKRNGQSMSLNNNGDTVELVAPDGTVVQTASYGKATAGQEVTVDGAPN
jgi:Lamin Tail Domain